MISDLPPQHVTYVLNLLVDKLYAPTRNWVNDRVMEIAALNAQYSGAPPAMGFIYRGKRYLLCADMRFPPKLDPSLNPAMDEVWEVEDRLLTEERAYVTNLCNFAASVATSYWHLYELLPEGLTKFLKEGIEHTDARRGDNVERLSDQVIAQFQIKHSAGIQMVKRRLTRNALNNFT